MEFSSDACAIPSAWEAIPILPPSSVDNAILASDAFFPFPDSIEIANSFGIKHFIQTGGSIKDQDVINKANKLKVSMIFTNQRLFFH